MAIVLSGRVFIGRDCSICQNAAAVVRSVIVDPLVISVTTYTCAGCYSINKAAADSLVAQTPRLVLTEVAA
jgi:hypothetical protein